MSGTIHLPGREHGVLLIHGLLSSPLELRFVGRVLNRAGFTVHVPQIPGYSVGTSITDRHDWIEAVSAEYRSLARQCQSVSIGGLCIGAVLAMSLVQRGLVAQSLTLLSATLAYDGWAIPWYAFSLEPLYAVGLGRRYVYREHEPFGLRNEGLRKRVARAMIEEGRAGVGAAELPAKALYEARRLGREVGANLGAIRTDTLLIHAVDDETASPRNTERIYRGISSRVKQKIMLGDSYHMISMDNEREIVARQMARFTSASIRRDFPSAPVTEIEVGRALARLERRRHTPVEPDPDPELPA
jgi:carboxylesterase